jgi:hypothetical protein
MILSENRLPSPIGVEDKLFGIMRRPVSSAANAAETAISAPIGARQSLKACETARAADNGGMAQTGEDDKKPKKSGDRDKRLKAALRENLRRRKAQERGRSIEQGPMQRPDSEPRNGNKG